MTLPEIIGTYDSSMLVLPHHEVSKSQTLLKIISLHVGQWKLLSQVIWNHQPSKKVERN